MTKEQRDRLVWLPEKHAMISPIVAECADFMPTPANPEEDPDKTQSIGPTIALIVNNLYDVAKLGAMYNNTYDNHKFWYEIRNDLYAIY